MRCAAAGPDPRRTGHLLPGPYEAEGLDFLAGMGQDNLDEFGLALEGEQALRPYIEAQLPDMAEATPEQLVEHMASLLPEVDRACLTGDVGADFAAAMNHAGRAGADGWIDDDLAQARAPVSLWQGKLDLMVPFAHGQWLAPRIPGVRAHLENSQGHLSIVVGAVDRMLDDLAALVTS